MGGAELCPSRMASLRRVLRDSPTARKRRWGLDRRAYGYTRSVGGPDLLGRGSHKKRGRRHTHTEGRPREDTGSTRGLHGPERGLGTARLGPAWVSDCCPPGQGEDKPVLFEPPLQGAPGRLPQRTDAVRSRLLCQPVSVTDTGRDRTARASAGGASDSETRSSLSDPVSASPGQLSLCGSAWAPSSGRESGGQRPGGDTRGTGGSPGATPPGLGLRLRADPPCEPRAPAAAASVCGRLTARLCLCSHIHQDDREDLLGGRDEVRREGGVWWLWPGFGARVRFCLTRSLT